MKKSYIYNILSLISNLCIAVFAVFGVRYYFIILNGDAELIRKRMIIFKYFTTLSNLFSAAVGILTVIFCVINIIRKKSDFPKWVNTLRLIATVCLGITMIVVLTFLAPYEVQHGRSYFIQLKNNYLFLHLINPLLSIVSFIFFEGTKNYKRRHSVTGVIPVAAYSSLYYYEAIIKGTENGGWRDFYNFGFLLRYVPVPVAGAVMLIGTFLLSLMFLNLQKIVFSKTKK